MASGKLSPRQKMINMMYLVLLALLAMNVSAEILNAFEQIKEKLAGSANVALSNNDQFIANMKSEIDDEIANEGKRKNEGLKDTLDQVQAETSELLAIINGHLTKMTEIADVDPETGKLKKKDETEANHQYWMGEGDGEEANGGRGEGEAFKLRDKLNGYVDYLVGIYNSQIPDSLASQRLTASDEYLAVDPEETLGDEKKTWERYTFEGPVIANMAILEALKLDVFEKEKKLLDLLNGRLGVATFKVDSVIPINAPTATIVPAGLQFQTKLFVSMSSSQITPTFSSGSGKIEQEGSVATLTIPASGGVIPKGKNEGLQKYSAMIRVPKATGGFANLPVEGEFVVRRPEVVVTSAAVQVLYRKCGNEVNIDVPALGDAYVPRISATNATVTVSPKSKKLVRIVPSGKSCVVTVNSLTNGQTVKIGDVNYRVINPPKPNINMAINGKAYNGASPVNKGSRIQLRIEPDEDFAAALPKDARYAVSGVEVLAALSLGPPQPINRVGAVGDATKPFNIPLGSKIRGARPGTKVFVRIQDVYRVNFEGKRVPVKFNQIEKTLSLVIK